VDNTPTFLPTQTYLVTSGIMKHVLVFVLDTSTYNVSNKVFCLVSPLCHEGDHPNFIMAEHLVKYEFFPEDEEI